MSAQVVHQPRVAWDAARAFLAVGCADEETFARFSGKVETLLGEQARLELAATRRQVLAAVRPDVPQVEAGKWRVRLEDLMRARPEAAEALQALTAEAAGR